MFIAVACAMSCSINEIGGRMKEMPQQVLMGSVQVLDFFKLNDVDRDVMVGSCEPPS